MCVCVAERLCDSFAASRSHTHTHTHTHIHHVSLLQVLELISSREPVAVFEAGALEAAFGFITNGGGLVYVISHVLIIYPLVPFSYIFFVP